MHGSSTYSATPGEASTRQGVRTSPGRRGMTVLELMVTMAVIGLLMLLGYRGVRYVRESSLREDTNEVATVLRAAYNMATMTGAHHRVVFDLDKQTYRIEACEGDLTLRRSEREEVPEEGEENAAAGGPAAQARSDTAGPEQAVDGDVPAELLTATSPEDAAKLAELLAGSRLGGARCMPPELPTGDADGRGAQRSIRTDEGIKIRHIFVQHLEGEQDEGIVHLNFFPLGYAEKAVIEIDGDGDNAFTLLVHRLTGRVELRPGKVDADEHMMRRADGEEVDER